MKKLSLTFFILFLGLILAGNAKGADPLLGSWTFTASQAPWEYSQGMLIIELNDDKAPAGKLVFRNNYEVPLTRISEQEKKYTLVSNIEGYTITTVVELKNDTLTGIARTPDGNIPFSAKRYVPEK